MTLPREGDVAVDGDPADPYDRDRSGYSLANNRELLFGCFEAAAATSVVEIGAEYGAFTRELLAWARGRAKVIAVDPLPQQSLLDLAAADPDLELVEQLSIPAFRSLPRLDAYVIDGDHNYYTVLNELRAIADTAGDDPFPLVVFHDVCWPHARRDSYYAPEQIPEEFRQPLISDVHLTPWSEGSEDTGIPYLHVAARDGGPRNGVLTAIEDFLESRAVGGGQGDDLRFARVPAFFGFAAMWPAAAPWADRIAALIEPLHEHPVLERLEGNRVVHLLERIRFGEELRKADTDRVARLEAELRRLRDSRAMAVAERLSALRGRGEPLVSRQRIDDALR